MTGVVLEMSGVSKDYHALRPLRIERLSVTAAERVAIVGFDEPAAEMFVNLVTGAFLPERGAITLLGRPTSAIADGTEWLALVDRVGIISRRAVLLDALSVVQNLAMPFTLQIEPPSDDVRSRAVTLAAQVGLAEAVWDRPVATLDAAAMARVRLARAVALDPAVLLLEHASAELPEGDAEDLASTIRDVAAARGAAVIAATADERFARALNGRVLSHDGASGRLAERRRAWFR